jgi:hypothetical protein
MAGAAGIDSDDFSSGSLSGFWTAMNWAPTFEGSGTADARIIFTNGSGDYSFWGDTDALFLHQPAAPDTDFTIVAKWDTMVGSQQEMGIFMFDNVPASASVSAVCGYFNTGTESFYHADNVGSNYWGDVATGGYTAPVWMWLEYVATEAQFHFYMSDTSTQPGTPTASRFVDNSSWTNAVVGAYSGNSDSSTASTQKLDYFWEVTDPIEPEDPVGGTRRVMVIS